MTEGTKSYLIGCHQFFLHPLFVFLAWRKHFGRYPKLWEIFCIILHDIGIIDRNYLSESKDGHWKRGAIWAMTLLGPKAFYLCAGHTPESGYRRSNLFWADKASWLKAWDWWLWSNFRLEEFSVNPIEWKWVVAHNLMQPNPLGSHELYINGWLKTEGA